VPVEVLGLIATGDPLLEELDLRLGPSAAGWHLRRRGAVQMIQDGLCVCGDRHVAVDDEHDSASAHAGDVGRVEERNDIFCERNGHWNLIP